MKPRQDGAAARTAAGTLEASAAAESPVIVIEPPRRWIRLGLRDLWERRELFYFLVWRDIKVRYKQTVIGAGWAVLQPLLTMVIFTAVFGKFARIPSDGIPYPVFAYTALLPWNLFAGALQRSVTSMITGAHLISKVYLPRLVIPLASTVSGLVDFAVAFGVLLGMMVWFDVKPTPAVLVLPLLLLLGLLCALAFGLWLSALNVMYRDVGHAIPFLIQFWMYATPVAYPASLVPQEWRLLYSLNPMVVVIEGFRWALLGRGTLSYESVLVAVVTVLAFLLGGVVYFRRVERVFADVI